MFQLLTSAGLVTGAKTAESFLIVLERYMVLQNLFLSGKNGCGPYSEVSL